MGIIHVLDTELSNKIAAGEVVERPASVAKELVENSIDAGSTTITIELRGGGVSYLRVTDNGKGMSEEDAKLCFLRHATSKIRTDEDLDAIYTLGFRGEALSSIGAVARVSLYTKQADGEGLCVTCCGGEILSSAEAGIPDGTSVIVEDLFYNTPARLKFLKKDATEAGYITDIITRCIFAHPEISFRLIVNGKEKLYSPGDSNLKNAVYTAYGKDYARGMLEVDYEANGIRVTGLIGKGNVSRPNRNYQSFFVNKRYIKSAMIFRAVEDAYKNQIMIGKFPVAVLNIEINPRLMDINVHPTKLEVKFANDKEVRNAVYYGVKNALYAIANVPEISRVDEETGEVLFERDTPAAQLDLSELARQLPKNLHERPEHKSSRPKIKLELTGDEEVSYIGQNKPMKEISRSEPKKTEERAAVQPKKSYAFGSLGKIRFNDVTAEEESLFDDEEASSTAAAEPKQEIMAEAVKGSEPRIIEKVIEITESAEEKLNEKVIEAPEQIKEEISENKPEDVFVDEYFRVAGQIFDTYIIVEKGDKMLIIDQHAAHERLKYEELKREMAEKQVMSQMLIEPVIVRLSASEYAAFEECMETPYNMGFECDVFGDSEVIVRGVPGDLEAGEVEELLVSLITNSARAKHELITEKYERMLYTIACKAAIKANHRLSTSEMETLVRNVFRLKNINTCPHGRPIVITMSRKEIEKEFKRLT